MCHCLEPKRLVGADLNYECCQSRGAVAALDANTGKVIWRTQSIQEPLRQLGENTKGSNDGDPRVLRCGTLRPSMPSGV